MPEFAQPLWLFLLVLLPGLAWLAWRSPGREGRVRQLAGTALRCVSIAALVVSLAGPLGGAYSRHTDVMFLMDVSDSIDERTMDRALAFVDRARQVGHGATRTGLAVFGADAAVEARLGGAAVPVREISAHVQRGVTDIERALEQTVGTFPAAGARRIVLISDGRENHGRARAASEMARSIGVEIHTIPLVKAGERQEVYVEGISAPRRVRENEPFQVQMSLRSKKSGRAHALLMRDGVVLRDVTLDLQPGPNTISVVDEAATAGLYEYEAVVNSEQDDIIENNRYQAFVRVSGAPRVLLAHGDSPAANYLGQALREQGLAVDERPGTALPATLRSLVEYDLVILSNVSGFDLSREKMEVLEAYVRQAGGGVIAIGGNRSYSAGGYHDTPVERLLPVTMDVQTEVKIPSLAVVILIDKSASMASHSQGGRKIDIAKVAALSAIEVLSPLDRIGVLAFDAGHQWSVAPTEVGNRRAIVENLRALGAGGSTDLVEPLREAHRVMARERARVKHLIVLSDGLTDAKADFNALSRGIAADGITISTVAFGGNADQILMSGIAENGRGRFYFTDDMQNVPRIFASETLVVSRDLFVEGATHPVIAYPGEMLAGFAPGDFPPLGGYQRTYPKPAAQVLLSAEGDDPLLVTWRYGLGKSAAFMSDLGGAWGRDWVAWSEFVRFAAQMARWTMRRSGGETMLPSFRWDGGRGEMTVDVLDAEDRFLNGLDLAATVSGPERDGTRIDLSQIAPGRYQGAFPVPRAGRYYVSISGSDGEVTVGPKTYGLAVPYSPEYLDLGVDEALLEDIAATTGGRVLPLSNAAFEPIYAAAPDRDVSRWRVWFPFLLVALVALVLEVAVRKIGVPESWGRRGVSEPIA